MNLMKESLELLHNAKTKIAIKDKSENTITFSELYQEIIRHGNFFKENGIKKGSKVLLLIPLDIELYSTIASLFAIGATVVLIDPWAKKDYIKNSLTRIKPDFIVLTKKAKIFFLNSEIRHIKKRIYIEKIKNYKNTNQNFEVEDVDKNHSALITFTSGTTGIPKAFDRSHEFLLAQQVAHEKHLLHSQDDIDITMYPVFVLSNLKSLMTTILIDGNLGKPDTISMEKLHKQIEKNKVTSISLSPFILEKYLNYLKENNLELKIKKIFTGGGPVPKSLIQKTLELNQDINAYILYGSTEAEPISIISFKDALPFTDASCAYPVGKIIEEHRYKLIPEKVKLHPIHKLEACELHLTGPFVGKKYVNNDEVFSENKYVDTEQNIWHKTGDILFKENENLFMLGRKSDLILTKDGGLYPLIIEADLAQKFSAEFCLQKINNSLILFYTNSSLKEKLKDYFDQMNLEIDHFIYLDSLPKDGRHHTKLDRKEIKYNFLKGNYMITHEASFTKRFMAYTKERFPLIPIFLFITFLSLGSASLLGSIYGQTINYKSATPYAVIITLFLFMLQIRLNDEVKDFEKDKIAYPERILSRGVISLSSIDTLSFVLMGGILLISYFLGLEFFITMLIIEAYAYLMKKEFFIPTFLEKRLGLYLITHQLILPVICFYAALISISFKDVSFDYYLVLPLIYLSLPSTLYELARKTWPKERENENADSYTKVWGIRGATFVQGILLLVLICLNKVIPVEFSSLYIALLFIFSFLYLITLYLFTAKPTLKVSKMLENTGSIYLLLLHILNTFLLL